MVEQVPMAILLGDEPRVRAAVVATRLAAELSQEDVAVAAGVSVSTIRRIEGGSLSPTVVLLIAILKTCGFSLAAVSTATSIPLGVGEAGAAPGSRLGAAPAPVHEGT